MPGGIFIYRADTHDILYANDRFLSMLGYDSLEALTQSRGHTFDDILSASDKERVFPRDRTSAAAELDRIR